ncbi:MAG: SxtJ family membrane protein [Arenicellales bacterium]|nr:SxtJ family membrane protein [Arenicellales bacterium]
MQAIPKLDKKGLRQFGFTFGGIIAGLFGLVIPWLFDLNYPYWPWVVLLVFATWALVAPNSLDPFYKLWMRFGLLLNAVMSRIILGIVYYLVVLPTGLIIRMRGHDPMNREFDSSLDSYRVNNEGTAKSQMEKPF